MFFTLDNIVGIKEATGDVTRVKILRENCKSSFILLSGDDGSVLDFIRAGGDGVISVVANVLPKEMSNLCTMALNNMLEEAELLDNKMRDLYKMLFVEANPIPVKWALKQLGVIQEGIRLPLTKLSVEYRDALQVILEQVCNIKLFADEYS